MQGTFPLPAAAGSYEKVSAESFGGAGTKKSFEDGGQDPDAGSFTPFTAVLAQAEAEKNEAPPAEESPSEESLAGDSLPEDVLAEGSLAEGLFAFDFASALSASQGKEKPKTGLSPNGDVFLADSAGFSKSLQGFLASLKAGLNKEGAEEGVGESLFGSLKSGLEGSLKKRRAAAAGVENAAEGGEALSEPEAQPDELVQGEEVLPSSASAEAVSELSAQKEEAAAELLAASRFHSYLKGGAAGASAASVSSKASKTEKAAKSGERSEGDSTEPSEPADRGGLSGQGTAVPVVLEEREGPNETPADAPKEGISRNRGFFDGDGGASARNASRDDAASGGKASEVSGERQGGTAQKRAATENRVNFDQFFDGIAGRRGFTAESGARPGALELGNSGTPLARDEALREGLTNVVRFVRVNGEQKASLIVDPPALGRVSVELTSNATGLEASIKVSSEQIRQLVQDQLTQLRWSLSQQGVQLTHFSVDVQQEDGGRRQQEPGRERRRARGISGLEIAPDAQDEEAGFRVDLDQGLLYWLA
jgi:flagellar hook-length control protein FliK